MKFNKQKIFHSVLWTHATSPKIKTICPSEEMIMPFMKSSINLQVKQQRLFITQRRPHTEGVRQLFVMSVKTGFIMRWDVFASVCPSHRSFTRWSKNKQTPSVAVRWGWKRFDRKVTTQAEQLIKQDEVSLMISSSTCFGQSSAWCSVQSALALSYVLISWTLMSASLSRLHPRSCSPALQLQASTFMVTWKT